MTARSSWFAVGTVETGGVAEARDVVGSGVGEAVAESGWVRGWWATVTTSHSAPPSR